MAKPRPAGEKPNVKDRRYLRPAEAHRLIDAAGNRGRYPFRDKVLVRLVYRHGLRASEAVGLRWSQLDLDQGVLHVFRAKGSKDSTHSLDRDELRDLRKLRQSSRGLYAFESERGGPLSVDTLQYIVREAGRLAKLDVEAHPHMLRHQRVGLEASTFSGHSLRSGFLTSAAESGANVFKMAEVSRHRSLDTLRGYVRRVDLFKEHAGAAFL